MLPPRRHAIDAASHADATLSPLLIDDDVDYFSRRCRPKRALRLDAAAMIFAMNECERHA